MGQCGRLSEPIDRSMDPGRLAARCRYWINDLGVKMAQPWFQVRHLERSAGLLAVSANFELYGDMSARMMAVAARLKTVLELRGISCLSLGEAPADKQQIHARRPAEWPSTASQTEVAAADVQLLQVRPALQSANAVLRTSRTCLHSPRYSKPGQVHCKWPPRPKVTW